VLNLRKQNGKQTIHLMNSRQWYLLRISIYSFDAGRLIESKTAIQI